MIVESFHHGDDDDTVGCVGSPVVDGLHQQRTQKEHFFLAKNRWCQRVIAIAKINIFGLVRVVKVQLDSWYSLILIVQVYSKFFASAFGIAFIIISSSKSIYSLWKILIIGLRGSVRIHICISSVKRQANLPTSLFAVLEF